MHCDRYLGIEEVIERVACSRATLYRMQNDVRLAFPRPVKLFSSSRWLDSTVTRWLVRQVELQAEAQAQTGNSKRRRA